MKYSGSVGLWVTPTNITTIVVDDFQDKIGCMILWLESNASLLWGPYLSFLKPMCAKRGVGTHWWIRLLAYPSSTPLEVLLDVYDLWLDTWVHTCNFAVEALIMHRFWDNVWCLADTSDRLFYAWDNDSDLYYFLSSVFWVFESILQRRLWQNFSRSLPRK